DGLRPGLRLPAGLAPAGARADAGGSRVGRAHARPRTLGGARPGGGAGAPRVGAARRGRSAAGEPRATPETLRRQSAVALAAGRTQLADNLARAAELADVPGGTILEIYTALRPHRSTAEELEACAARLETEFDAPLTAAFVREAATAYAERGLLETDERAAV